MLAVNTVAEIRRLLAAQMHSQREIARLLGISRGSVGAVASGKWRERTDRPAATADMIEPLGPPTRCPGCGGLVYLPCVRCRAESYRPTTPCIAGRRGATASVELPALNLRPEHYARYQQVLAWRRENEQQGEPI